MAVFLFNIMLRDVLIDRGFSFLLKVRRTIYFVSDTIMAVVLCIIISMIINKNTAMIVSLTKICCPFDLKKKRTPTVSQNVSQYKHKQKHSDDSVTN
jgi:hypothetical protein